MEKGAASPGRWQVWQCFCKIGATSLVNVGGGLLGSCPSANPAQHSVPASRMDKYFMNFPTSREQSQSDVRLPRKHTQVDLRIPSHNRTSGSFPGLISITGPSCVQICSW